MKANSKSNAPVQENGPSELVIDNRGSIGVITPMSEYAKDWIAENLSAEPWQWMGGSLCIDSRYAADIAAIAEDAGLTVTLELL